MVSIVIPVHDMENGDFFLKRCLDSIRDQSYQDYEIIIKKTGKGMAHNCNIGMKEAKGSLIKILFMDDYFATKDSLKDIVENFTGDWLVTGCTHDNGRRFNPHLPAYNNDIHLGNNTIGSPSVLTIRNNGEVFFDPDLQWLIDCDFYKRLHEAYGEPTILNKYSVVIGIHPGQQTNLLSEELKSKEAKYMKEKYD